MHDALTNLAPELWIATRQITNELGTITTRMTVVRLKNGRLLVHSPVSLDSDLRLAVENRGTIEALIAPNKYHHQFVPEWTSTFPKAKLFGAPGLVTKRSDLKFDGVLGTAGAPAWTKELEPLLMDGLPLLSEVVFFHHSSRTLLVSDIAFNYAPAVALTDPGAADGLGPHRRIRSAISDPNALRKSIDKILLWPFDRVIVAHGEIVEADGRALFRAGFAFLWDD